MTPTLNAIQREHWRIRSEDDRRPSKIRMTFDVYQTCITEWDRSQEGSIFNRSSIPEAILGMPIERVPVGDLDAPCWQIMVT